MFPASGLWHKERYNNERDHTWGLMNSNNSLMNPNSQTATRFIRELLTLSLESIVIPVVIDKDIREPSYIFGILNENTPMLKQVLSYRSKSSFAYLLLMRCFSYLLIGASSGGAHGAAHGSGAGGSGEGLWEGKWGRSKSGSTAYPTFTIQEKWNQKWKSLTMDSIK